jgi:hypothetical protein
LWAAFLGIGLPLGLIGVWTLSRRNGRLAAALLLTTLPHALFFTGYPAVDKETMFLPVYLIWALLLGVGLARLLQKIPMRLHLLALLLPASLFFVNLPYTDVSDFRLPYERANRRLVDAGQGALYLATWGDAELMRYHQMVRGVRPDVEVINLFFVTPDTLAALLTYKLETSHIVYSTVEVALPAGLFLLQEPDESYRILSQKK